MTILLALAWLSAILFALIGVELICFWLDRIAARLYKKIVKQ